MDFYAANDLSHCVRYKPKLQQQLMGNLPVERLTPSRPFAYCGVDFCGPVNVYLRIRGKAPSKSYIAIFVCFATKAVHIEMWTESTPSISIGDMVLIHEDNVPSQKWIMGRITAWTRSASSSRGCLHQQGSHSETNSFYAYNRLPKLDITPNPLENLMLDRKTLLILQRDWKGAVRKKLAHNRRETSATVGGPYAQLALSDAEQTVATFRCARY
ncbi:hypothetical protein ACLKA6_008630 [Drosophila palustris]